MTGRLGSWNFRIDGKYLWWNKRFASLMKNGRFVPLNVWIQKENVSLNFRCSICSCSVAPNEFVFASWNDSRKKTQPMAAAGWTHGSTEMIQGVQLYPYLGGGFKHFFYFHPYLGKMIQFWRAYFSDGLVQPPTRYLLCHQVPRVIQKKGLGKFCLQGFQVETFNATPLELWNDIYPTQNKWQWHWDVHGS